MKAHALAVMALSLVAVAACSHEPAPRERVVAEASDHRPGLQPSSSRPSIAASAASAPPAAPSAATAGKLVFLSPPADMELGAYLRTERLRAKAEGRLLVLYAGASWCPPCKRFHAAAHGGQLDAELGRTTLVELDADRDSERLKALGYVFKNIPYFAVPAENGRPARALAVEDTSMGAQRQITDTLTMWQLER